MLHIETQNPCSNPALREEPFIATSASITDSRFGRYTEVQEHCELVDVELNDYSYVMEKISTYGESK